MHYVSVYNVTMVVFVLSVLLSGLVRGVRLRQSEGEAAPLDQQRIYAWTFSADVRQRGDHDAGCLRALTEHSVSHVLGWLCRGDGTGIHNGCCDGGAL